MKQRIFFFFFKYKYLLLKMTPRYVLKHPWSCCHVYISLCPVIFSRVWSTYLNKELNVVSVWSSLHCWSHFSCTSTSVTIEDLWSWEFVVSSMRSNLTPNEAQPITAWALHRGGRLDKCLKYIHTLYIDDIWKQNLIFIHVNNTTRKV